MATKRHVDKLSFDVVVPGTEMTSSGGGFSTRGGGHWILTKIFLGKHGDGEVFLDIDPVAGVGAFALKDADYGDIVLDALASVL